MIFKIVQKACVFFCMTIVCMCHSEELSVQESAILSKFFREMTENSEAGYVFFDAKPVCIHGYNVEDNFTEEYPRHLMSVILREGALVLKNRKFCGQNILIHSYNHRDALVPHCVHILFINKKLFLDVVQHNLSLFQYVLGPEVTPKKLLDKLTDSEDSFHNVLNADKALIGILLGFGTQNSLYVSRIEEMDNALHSESPPLSRCFSKFDHPSKVYKELVFLNCLQARQVNREPSFGYSSIEEEMKDLTRRVKVSSAKLENCLPSFIFGHVQDNDSQLLITKLENAQEKSKQLLSSKTFSQEALNLAFPDERIILQPAAEVKLSFTQEEAKRLPFLVAANILNNMENIEPAYVKSFIAGMKLSEESKDCPVAPARFSTYWDPKKLLKIKNNLRFSDEYFALLSQNKSMTCLAPLRLYYRLTTNGEDPGPPLQLFTKVVVHYTITLPDGEVLVDTFKSGSPEKIDLHETIPGFALGMKGMKIGEEREVFIHPSLAYGIFTALDKGMYLKAQIRLVDIYDTSDDKDVLDFSNVEVLDLHKELDNLGVLEEKECIEISNAFGLTSGYQIWQHYKKEPGYTLSQILEWIRLIETEKVDPDISSVNDQNLINRLHWNLYQAT
ncbi:MAG: FKBP-type peptidyl-prolyl cis-trans isomerase [Parachlamydiaceae bacterium]